MSAEAETLPEATLVPAVETPKCVCKQCGMQVSFEDLAVEKHDNQAYAVCRLCHNLQAMLGKRFGLRNFQEALSPEKQVEFFRRCLSTAENGVLSFKNVRAQLKEQVTESYRSETQYGTEGCYKPLSVWEKEGYDTSLIRAKAKTKQHPMFGEVYAVDWTVFSDKTIMSMVEEKIQKMERDVKRKSSLAFAEPKPKKKAKGAPEPEVQVVALTAEQEHRKQEIMDLTGLDSDSDDQKEWKRKGVKAGKAAENLTKKAEREAAREAMKFTRKITPVIGKCLAQVGLQIPKMEKALAWCAKNADSVPQMVVDSLETELKELQEWEKASKEAMKKTSESKTLEPDMLPYGCDKDLAEKLKACKGMVQTVNLHKPKPVPKSKPKAKAKA